MNTGIFRAAGARRRAGGLATRFRGDLGRATTRAVRAPERFTRFFPGGRLGGVDTAFDERVGLAFDAGLSEVLEARASEGLDGRAGAAISAWEGVLITSAKRTTRNALLLSSKERREPVLRLQSGLRSGIKTSQFRNPLSAQGFDLLNTDHGAGDNLMFRP